MNLSSFVRIYFITCATLLLRKSLGDIHGNNNMLTLLYEFMVEWAQNGSSLRTHAVQFIIPSSHAVAIYKSTKCFILSYTISGSQRGFSTTSILNSVNQYNLQLPCHATRQRAPPHSKSDSNLHSKLQAFQLKRISVTRHAVLDASLRCWESENHNLSIIHWAAVHLHLTKAHTQLWNVEFQAVETIFFHSPQSFGSSNNWALFACEDKNGFVTSIRFLSLSLSLSFFELWI